MNYSEIKFEQGINSYYHNLGNDFACFALWKPAIGYRTKIHDLLASDFEILLETEIIWSDKNLKQNARRLYESPLKYKVPLEKWPEGHERKIGGNNFILFVVKDSSPTYTYARSVSNQIELSNIRITHTKETIRQWIYKDLNVNFGIHSTNNIHEFFFQAPLLLGVSIFEKLIAGKKINLPKLEKDLEGADGWETWEDFFSVLNYTSDYLVLRGFEGLPRFNKQKDLDVLTAKYQRFASAAGALQVPHQPYKGVVYVDGEKISLDIRYVGDDYYDASWAKEMLLTKIMKDGVQIPRADHYFFSLLFHAKVQKPQVKPDYIGILDQLATALNFEWFKADTIDDDKAMGILLNGYFKSNGYFYKDPLDSGVYKNYSVIRELPKQEFSTVHNWIIKLKAATLTYAPKGMIRFLKNIKKRYL